MAFRARACWAPARSEAEAADELRLRLAEGRDALGEQRCEHARLRQVKHAFEANLELRTRELELVVGDLNRCRRGATARTAAAPPLAQKSGSTETRRVVEALAGAHGRVAAVERRLRQQAASRVGLEGTLRDADVAVETARVERAYAEAAYLLRVASGTAPPPASGAASLGRRAQATLPPHTRDVRVEAAYGGKGARARPASEARRWRDDARRSDCALAGDAAREAARLISLRNVKKKKKDERVRAKRTRAAEVKKRRLDAEFRRTPGLDAIADIPPFNASRPDAVADIPPSNAKASRPEGIATKLAEANSIAAKESEKTRIATKRAEVERNAAEEARLEAERLKAKRVEADHVAAENEAKTERREAEAKRLAEAEAKRLAEAEAREAEARADRERANAARKAADEAERLENERLAAKEAIYLEAERLEAERTEAERKAAEERRVAEAGAEKAKKEAEAAARIIAENLEQERAADEASWRATTDGDDDDEQDADHSEADTNNDESGAWE